MPAVPVITDGNLYALKTANHVPIEEGEETITSGMDDFNRIRARLSEQALAINANFTHGRDVLIINTDLLLTNAHSGLTILVESDVQRLITIADAISDGWWCYIIRDGSQIVEIIGEAAMNIIGPAAVAGMVTLADDEDGAVFRRVRTNRTWAK
jgi:hypothetical protein